MTEQVSVNNEPALKRLLGTYPRSRVPLPQEYRAILLDHYRKNRSGRSGLSRVVSRLEAWMHRRVASRAADAGVILELGAGTLNHVPYERSFAQYDVVEPWHDLMRDSPFRDRVSRVYADIREVPEGQQYDRILSVAALEHLLDLPHVLARCGLLLKPRGLFQAGIPSEGGLAWGLAWRLTTGLAFRITRGLSYGPIMRHEHVSTAGEILALTRYFFRKVSVSRFPLPGLHFSFYTYLEASDPDLVRCAGVLGCRNGISHLEP